MSTMVDTTPVDQGKRKRSLKTLSSQGSKRVKSSHEEEKVNDDKDEMEKVNDKDDMETPSKQSNGNDNAVVLQPTGGQGKKVRRGNKKNRDQNTSIAAPPPSTTTTTTTSTPTQKSLWTLQQPTGGRYIAHDPVVTPDDSYVFASNGRELQVLSVATSLVERRLPARSHTVTAFALSNEDPEQIHIASNRTVQTWDWVTGTIVGEPIEYDGKIHAVCSGQAFSNGPEVLYTICQVNAEYRIMAGKKVIYTSREALSYLSLEADYILTASPKTLIVGRRLPSAASTDSSVEHARFTFIELASPVAVTCLAGRVEQLQANKKKSGPHDMLAVAAGNAEGQIMVYEDVFAAARPDDVSLMPRTLHWHREAVASLKWSKDGNYIISGGRETTLVLWQLSTGKSQFLPHLTAEIERLTVSPSGTCYAIQLADNSVMLLSTTELKPIANFAHLQAQTVLGQDLKTKKDGEIKPAAAALHPAHGDRLFIAVPPSMSISSRPFLQTYDITNDRHVSRQALTRNNVTDFNRGPENNKIEVPDVPFLKLSEDGQWLATVEEWCPPSTDLDYLATSENDPDITASRREVYLKIWQWDTEKSQWTLETRIDNPHQLTEGAQQPARILALVSDPAENGFATIGTDSCVRIWKPKTRLRGGLVVRGANAQGLVDWSCRHTIQLNQNVDLLSDSDTAPPSTIPSHATLAYSPDASLLTASQTFECATIPPVINFINTATGEISQTLSNLTAGSSSLLLAQAFLSRHLLLVTTSSITLHDVVTASVTYTSPLPVDASSSSTLLVATNAEDQTFAVVVSSPRKSWIRVWGVGSSTPEWCGEVNKGISGVLSQKGRKGYLVLSTSAEVQRLVPRIGGVKMSRVAAGDATAVVVVDDAGVEQEQQGEEMDVDGETLFAVHEGEEEQDDDDDDEEADKPVVRPEELARVFEQANVALMPVRDMFEAVVGLYARKPRGGVVAVTA